MGGGVEGGVCEAGGISGTQSLLRLSYFPGLAAEHQMLNQGVTQTYLIVKTSRNRILIGSEIMRIKKIYIVTSCTRLMRLYILRANSVRMQIQCTKNPVAMKKITVGNTPKITRAQIAAWSLDMCVMAASHEPSIPNTWSRFRFTA